MAAATRYFDAVLPAAPVEMLVRVSALAIARCCDYPAPMSEPMTHITPRPSSPPDHDDHSEPVGTELRVATGSI